jgi:hypothetical protein
MDCVGETGVEMIERCDLDFPFGDFFQPLFFLFAYAKQTLGEVLDAGREKGEECEMNPLFFTRARQSHGLYTPQI